MLMFKMEELGSEYKKQKIFSSLTHKMASCKRLRPHEVKTLNDVILSANKLHITSSCTQQFLY